MKPIPLAVLLGADLDPTMCKLHCAVWNGEQHPIDVLSNDPEGWQGWNSYRSNKDDFNRKFIFSLAQDRHDLTLWLFGGVWEVLERGPEQHARSYKVALREDLMGPYIRRLYVRLALGSRQRRRKMESVLDEMTVSSILEEPFVGDPFPGHDQSVQTATLSGVAPVDETSTQKGDRSGVTHRIRSRSQGERNQRRTPIGQIRAVPVRGTSPADVTDAHRSSVGWLGSSRTRIGPRRRRGSLQPPDWQTHI